jgi:hypothetical protein
MDLIYRGTFSRAELADVDWRSVDPSSAIRSAEGAELVTRGRTRELVPVEIDQEWESFLGEISEFYLCDWERLRGQTIPDFDPPEVPQVQ